MKNIKIKPLVISVLACLAPILLGLAVYGSLPEQVAIHFDVNNVPDGFASKAFAVFGLPALMAVLQIFCCIVNDINAAKKGMNKKFEDVVKAVVPVITIIIYTAIIIYALGASLDIRRIAVFVVGIVFIALGNYMPKLDNMNYVRFGAAKPKNPKTALRIIGYMTVIIGVIFLVTLFLPPMFSAAAILLIIPYAVAVCVIAAVK